MKRLRKHQRVDRISTEVRAPRGSLGKWIYLFLLSVLALWLLDLFVGRYFYFQADGMVMRDTQTLGLSYPAQVRKLYVRDGDSVRQGELLGEVVSMHMIEQLTTLAIKVSDHDAKIRTDKARLSVIDATLDLAKKRADDMVRLRTEQEKAIARGLTSTQNMSELLQDEFDSRIQYKQMQSERQFLKTEIEQLFSARQELQNILIQTRDLYQEGRIIAPESGIVANLQSHAGSVIKPGDKMLDILYGKPYVLAYLDPYALYTIDRNDEVSILFGSEVLAGKVQQIYPLSAELPKEFQRTFRPLERSTVVFISLMDEKNAPPIFTTVDVYSSGLLIRWIKTFF